MQNINLPWVESPFFSQILETKNLSAEHKAMTQSYHQNGFLKLENLIPVDLIDQVRLDGETKAFNPNFPVQTQRDERRIQDFWMYSEAAKQLASSQPILEVLEMLYGRAAIPFQTLHFCVGSQQRAHSDAIHFSSLPARFMCGVWVALEDVTLENGPLFYYPGSHKMPEYNFSHIKNDAGRSSYADYLQYEDFIQELINVNEYKQEILIAKKGDALLWSSNILHGGMPVLKDGSSRWSQVTHYFFEDCYYYTPMLSNMVTNELFLRTQVKNIKTNETVASSYNRHTLDFVQTGESNYMFNPNIAAPNIATPKLGVIDMLRFIRRNMRKKS
jgi:ectoine hydroxylase-related dioxygenase (phytanoyl-CoA dioxygenase family)